MILETNKQRVIKMATLRQTIICCAQHCEAFSVDNRITCKLNCKGCTERNLCCNMVDLFEGLLNNKSREELASEYCRALGWHEPE